MAAKSIFLSAGHSNDDAGAITHQSINGKRVVRTEAAIAVEARNIVAFYLHRAGDIDFELDGHGLKNLPLREAVAKARRHPIAVEFHCNASDSPKATGCETLSRPEDYALGVDLCLAISSALGIRSRGAKPENAGQHHRLAFVQAGGVIVEMFFLSNPDDLRAWDEKKWLMCRDVARVLAQHAGSRTLL